VSGKKPEGPIEEERDGPFGRYRIRRINNRTFDMLFDDDPDRRFKRVTVTSGTVPYAQDLDEMRDRGQIAPDTHFLWKRTFLREGKVTATDAFRRAFLDLLRNHKRLGIPLSQKILDRAAAELEGKCWPDPKA
jgi:hypothetical protein